MERNAESDDKMGLIANMFAVMSARLQEMEGQAIKGEARSLEPEVKRQLAYRIHAFAREIATLADATAALIGEN